MTGKYCKTISLGLLLAYIIASTFITLNNISVDDVPLYIVVLPMVLLIANAFGLFFLNRHQKTTPRYLVVANVLAGVVALLFFVHAVTTRNLDLFGSSAKEAIWVFFTALLVANAALSVAPLHRLLTLDRDRDDL